MEVVTEPDLRSPAQARAYGETLRDLLRFIGASDADMEAGSMRIEGNVSIREAGSEMFGTKVEVKNLNSFRSLERAMEFEVERMTESLAAGVPLTQGDPRLGRGRADRGPALEGGERLPYFPEPDLPPLRPSPEWVAELASSPSCPPRAGGGTGGAGSVAV